MKTYIYKTVIVPEDYFLVECDAVLSAGFLQNFGGSCSVCVCIYICISRIEELEASLYSKISVEVCQNTRRQFQYARNTHSHCHNALKSHANLPIFIEENA
jgi:hypothetical protein